MNIISYIKDHWKEILITLLSIVCIALLMSTTCSNRKNHVLQTNIDALNDTLHVYELKNGELMYEKQGFIAEKNELEKYIGVKESEVKELEKKLGSALATISKLKSEVHVDTILMHDSTFVDHDSIYHNHFYYSDDWLRIDGISTFTFDPFKVSTTMNDVSLGANLKIGMSKDNKWFATSDNPYIYFTSVEGANLNAPEKQNRWSFSLQFGVGGFFGYGVCIPVPSGTVQSGLVTGAGFYGGVGASYRIL